MITLYQAAPAFGLPSLSPYCVKLELFLKAAKLDYQVKRPTSRAPNGKVPYIEHEGKLIGDSTFIVEYLVDKFGIKIDNSLTRQQRALGRLVQRTLEEATSPCGAYFRYVVKENWPRYRDAAFASAPRWLRIPFGVLLRRRIANNLWAQGVGRHDATTVTHMMEQDWQAVATVLGESKYLLGDHFTSFDCCLYAFASNNIRYARHIGERGIGDDHPSLLDYCERIEREFGIARPLKQPV